MTRSSSSQFTVSVALRNAEHAADWVRVLARELPEAAVAVDTPDSSGADYAVLWKQPPGFFARHPGLRAVFAAGAGVDWLMSDSELPSTLAIYRIEDAGMARQMAAYCCHEVLRLHYGYDRYEAQQRERRWRELPYRDPSLRTVGVFGLGVLGSAIAQAIAGFGFATRGYSRSPKALAGVQTFDARHGLQRFLEGCDVLVIAAPATAETRDLFNAERLGWLSRGAYVINVARGDLLVEDDLLSALDSGQLSGATLDVFRTEPLPPSHRFWTHRAVRITPHSAAITVIDDSARQVATRLRELRAGTATGGLVDRERAY
jgi:glyoxylate/hydroxypyruvate reductase A